MNAAGGMLKSIETIDVAKGVNSEWEPFESELPVGVSKLESR